MSRTLVTSSIFSPVTATGTTTGRTLQDRFADVVNVKDFGAVGDGVTDDTAAIQAAFLTNKPVYIPQGNYKTDSLSATTVRLASIGAEFSGLSSIDVYPAFGTGAFKTIAKGSVNSFIGIAHNNLPPNTLSFPTGVTGYGRNDNSGNHAFGIYAEARQYASTGVVTNEIDSFNHTAIPSTNLPPDRSIGTLQNHPVALTVGAGGNYDSSIGIDICREGSQPRSFLTGIYLNADACKTFGIVIDASSTQGPELPLLIKHRNSQPATRLQAVGTDVSANNAVLIVTNVSSVDTFSVRQDGRVSFNVDITQSTRGVAGAAQTLPSNPDGYLKILINGITKLIPYYPS